MHITSKHCVISDQHLLGVLITVSLITIALVASGVLNTDQTTVAASFIVILGVFGLVGLLKDISILRCPNRVLVGAAVFVTATSLLDSYIF